MGFRLVFSCDVVFSLFACEAKPQRTSHPTFSLNQIPAFLPITVGHLVPAEWGKPGNRYTLNPPVIHSFFFPLCQKIH